MTNAELNIDLDCSTTFGTMVRALRELNEPESVVILKDRGDPTCFAPCPHCNDSIAFRDTENGVTVHCLSGCRAKAIVTGMGLPNLAASLTYPLVDRLAQDEYRKLAAREKAKDWLSAEKASVADLPDPVSLDDLLAEPDEDIRYVFDRLWPAGGRVVLAARQKSGKSTLVGNVLRSLADGLPFLGTYDVDEAVVGEGVTLIDNELDRSMLRRWLKDQGIMRTNSVEIFPIRGRLSTFNILDPRTRTQWAEKLYGNRVLIFDCLRPVLDALGLSEDKDAGRFLEALDELTAEAEIDETLVVHHVGHGGERARGDSRIQDWPDALWHLRLDEADPADSRNDVPRYFSAYGRDVSVSESLLGYDPSTRRLHIAGGSRAEVMARDALAWITTNVLTGDESMSQRSITEACSSSGHARSALRQGLEIGVRDGVLKTEQGPRRSILYSLVIPECASAPSVRRRTADECASAPIERRTQHTHSEQPVSGEDSAHSIHALRGDTA